jgi:CHAD domain-containing protein
MAKAREIGDLKADDAYALAATKIVGTRVDELIEHSRNVLDVGDIERVHDMRVATRRLRAALEIFEACFPRQELKAAIRAVKDLADALGERRDRDVAIASLEEVSAAVARPDRVGIETLIERLRIEQATANEALARIVNAHRLASLADQLSELVRNAASAPLMNGALASEDRAPTAHDSDRGHAENNATDGP